MSKASIYINGIIGEDTTLTGVISQFKAFDSPTEVEVVIKSNGGGVQEGLDIYNYLKNLDIPVTTIASPAYSIAASIFMAGDTRLVEDIEAPLMLHMPLIQGLTGNSDVLKAVTAELEKIEKQFINFYDELIDIPKETIEALLDNETFLTPDEAVNLGFATGKKEALRPVAFYEGKKIEKSLMSKFEETLNAIAEKLNIKKKPVALVLQDATGQDVDFYELEDGDTPAVGDKARIDGADAEGEVVMPSGETFVFEGGAVSEIKPAEEEEEEEEEVEEVEEEAEAEADVKAEVIKEVLKWEIDVDQEGIQEGVQLTRTYEDETYNIGAGEWELADGRRAITDSSGTVVLVKDADAAPAEEEVEEEAEASAEAETSETESLQLEIINKLVTEIADLKKLVGSAEVNVEPKPKPVAKAWENMTPLERRRASKL